MSRSIAWPEAVAYQHEIVHTGVLRQLLTDHETAASVVSSLTGHTVAQVAVPHHETRVPVRRDVHATGLCVVVGQELAM